MTHGPHFPAAVPRLLGNGVLLRPLAECDIAAWFSRATDAEAAELAGDRIPASIEEGAAWLERHGERFRARAAIRWAIVTPAAADSVGTVGLTITSPDRREGELSVVVGRAHWGKGIGTAAASAVVAYAFDALGIRELQAEVLQRNLASVRLLEKLGFHLSRTVSAQEAVDGEACFHFSLRGHAGTAA